MPLFAVRVVDPFLDDPPGLPAAAVVVMPAAGALPLLPGPLLVVILLVLSRGGCGLLGRGRPDGLLRVAPVVVPPPAVVAGTVPAIAPPLPGSLALRGPVLLPSLLRLLRRLGRGLLPGRLWLLRILFCHDCQTD